MKHFTALVVTAALVFYGLFLGLIYSRGLLSEKLPPPPAKNPAGWDRLTQCSDLISFDGMRTLTLDDDHKATFGRETSDDMRDATAGQDKSGRWALADVAAETYSIDLDGRATTYTLVMPHGAEGCMLAPGADRRHVDLEGSWFSRPDPDDP